MTNKKTMLKIKNINTFYGQVHALRNVSLHLAEGEIVTLIGANGAGKTTLLNTLSGIVPLKSGEVIFDNTSIAALAPHSIVCLLYTSPSPRDRTRSRITS